MTVSSPGDSGLREDAEKVLSAHGCWETQLTMLKQVHVSPRSSGVKESEGLTVRRIIELMLRLTSQ